MKINTLCEQYLNQLYHQVRGHGVNQRQQTHITETYGEILFPSVNKLLSTIKMSDHDIFFDLGSGLGKVILQAFMLYPIKEACGIEIIPELHQKSQVAAQTLRSEWPEFFNAGRKITFILGSFLEISLRNATVILIGSPCFSPKMLCELGKLIEDAPNIHTVLTLRPLPTLNHLPFIKALRIECSWDSALCYLYTTKAPSISFPEILKGFSLY